MALEDVELQKAIAVVTAELNRAHLDGEITDEDRDRTIYVLSQLGEDEYQ